MALEVRRRRRRCIAPALACALWLAVVRTWSPAHAASADPLHLSPVDRECIALAAYWEAHAEGSDGMVAVVMVVLNRTLDPRFPDTACAVVHEGGEQPGCQFSFWCDGKLDTPEDESRWRLAQSAVLEALARQRHGDDPTRAALFFHSSDIATPWRVERQETARIGKHVFYR